MDQIFDMMKTWTPFGQGFFLFLMVVIFVSAILHTFKYFVALFRGWPPVEDKEEEKE